jgi:hypothetical protein
MRPTVPSKNFFMVFAFMVLLRFFLRRSGRLSLGSVLKHPKMEGDRRGD